MESNGDQTADSPPQPLRNTGDEPKVVVVAIDASPSAARIVSMAARLSRSLPAAAMHVVHVLRVSRINRATPGAPRGPSADDIAEAKEYLDYHLRMARKQSRNQFTGHFLLGDPTTELLRVCADLRADMLVIGTHDYSTFERLLLGSVAETLMRKANCSVLVVRPASTT